MTTPQEDAPDARLVRLEIEVPGTPEEVWDAIATGPGIECWFVPAEVDEREGGTITTHHGPYGDSTGTVTAWDPPRRFAYEQRDWAEGNPPPWATELLVEARAGGTCVVRLVSGVFSNGEDWAEQIDPTEDGWRQGLDNLRIYLTHFPGAPCSSMVVVAKTSTSQDRAWADLTRSLGLDQVGAGERASARPDAPPLGGIVERAADGALVLRTDQPAPGIVEMFAFAWDQTHVTVRAYLYGDEAPAVIAREEPAWRSWLDERFPPAEAASGTGAAAG